MRLSVWCSTCAKEAASAETSDPDTIGILVLAAHACQPHSSNHHLEIRIDGKEPPSGTHELHVRCLYDQCGSQPREKTWRCPRELASGLVNVMHASHEGHALEVTYDGVKYALTL